MDHIERRIFDFIKYRPGIGYITIGDLMLSNTHIPTYRSGRWAVDCTLDIFSVPMVTAFIQQYDLAKTCVFLTSCPDIAQTYKDLGFRYFPYFVAEGIAQTKTANELENPAITWAPRKNKISCVNRFARFNRIYALYKIKQQSNLTDCKISFTRMHPQDPDPNGKVDNSELTLDQIITWFDHVDCSISDYGQREHFINWLTEEYQRWPYQFEEQDNFDNKYDNIVKCEAFSDCYANIVTETYVLDYLPTEKTVKPLLAGCLFFPVAGVNFMKKLEQMGFDLKFEGIDYERYDSNGNWFKRTDAVIELANEVHPDLVDIWHTNRARLEYNRGLFFTKQLEDHVLQDVRDIFDINY
jgi:hypothetical protein